MSVVQAVRAVFRISHGARGFAGPLSMTVLATVALGVTCMAVAWAVGLGWSRWGAGPSALVSGLVGVALAYVLASMQARLRTTLMACDMVARARMDLGEHLRLLPLSFFRSRDPGSVTAYLLQDMVSVENVFSQFFVELAASVVLPLAFACLLFPADWRLALPLCLVFAAALPVLGLARRAVRDYGRRHVESRNRVLLHMMEYVSGVRELRSCLAAGLRFRPLAEALRRQRASLMRFELSSVGPILAYCALLDLGFLAMLLLGLWLLAAGRLDLGLFAVFLVLGQRFFDPLRDLGAFFAELRGMGSAAVRISEVLDTPPLPVAAPLGEPRGHALEFRNVGFSYDGRTPTLAGISFTVAEGSVTALAGPSGGGKTTMASLVARFWDVGEGAILLGGADIRSLPPEELLGRLCVVFQDVHLFHDTVLENIRMGRPGATRQEVVDAARAACCHEFILRLPQGYDTVVGGVSSGLSGGERQRLSIARAMLKNAPVVLLDEATSSLDPENEVALQLALGNLVRGKTVLVIAHRLATIRHADQIIVLDGGRVAERGAHEQLMAAKGLYRRHWDLQHEAEDWRLCAECSARPDAADLG